MYDIASDLLFFVFNFPSTSKVIWRRRQGLVSSDRLVKPGIEPATSGLQGKGFIHYTTGAPTLHQMSHHDIYVVKEMKSMAGSA